VGEQFVALSLTLAFATRVQRHHNPNFLEEIGLNDIASSSWGMGFVGGGQAMAFADTFVLD